MSWQTNGILTNPTGGTVLADSGPLGAAKRSICFVAAANITAIVVLEHRNAANDATLKSQAFMVLASAPLILTLPWAVLDMADNERLRITLNATIVGSIQASTFVD